MAPRKESRSSSLRVTARGRRRGRRSRARSARRVLESRVSWLFVQKFVLTEKVGDHSAPRAHGVIRIGKRTEKTLPAGVVLRPVRALARGSVADDAGEELECALDLGRNRLVV